MKIWILAISLVIYINVFSQDTIKVMHYNLLNYGYTPSYCPTTINNIVDKAAYVKTIVDYVKPDVLTVNEMSGNSFAPQHLLDSSLNRDADIYGRAVYANASGDDLINMLYYNKSKLSYHSQVNLQTPVRDFNIYKLYYNSPTVPPLYDTTFIRFIVVHLKAGSTPSDQSLREQMSTVLMNYLNSDGNNDNCLLMGDFNIQSSSETAFQNFIYYSNTNIRFYDPINQLGNWNNNSSFANYHSQSTHSSSNGCASSGGMDDRFDFILASNNIMSGAGGYQYISGTYKSLGNDGNHFNQSINSGSNTSVPFNVLNALYNMSDHLPIILNLKTSQSGAAIRELDAFAEIRFENPVTDKLVLNIKFEEASDFNIEIFSVLGQKMFDQKFTSNENQKIEIPFSSFEKGIYFVRFSNQFGQSITKKLLKF
ncbi:MAG: T9SS type A sorting domain-containing protein [Saprospiraceae bacterium]|nr:T9SS type A sorting domain-containing protein [Saprospiraceae bacterium]